MHVDEEVSEELVEVSEETEEDDHSVQGSNASSQPVPLAVVTPPAMSPQDVPPQAIQKEAFVPPRVGWKRRTSLRHVGDNYYHDLLMKQLHRNYPTSQIKTYYHCTKHVHPLVGSEWGVDLSVAFSNPLTEEGEVGVVFVSVTRCNTLGYALADVAQQAY